MSTFTVLNGNDGGVGSLRQAVANANFTPGSTIVFDPSVTLVTLTSGVLNLSRSTTITGNGSALTEITRNLASANFAIFRISGLNLNISISGIKLTNGGDGAMIVINTGVGTLGSLIMSDVVCANSSSSSALAGGISVSTVATVQMTNVEISGCVAAPLNNGGGLSLNKCTNVNISNSTFSNNTTSSGGSGSGMYVTTTSPIISNVLLTNVTMSNNTAATGGGGAAISLQASNTTNSFTGNNLTLINNTAGGIGGAINSQFQTNITNSTITGNTSAGAGGIFCSGTVFSISNSNVSNNICTSGTGGGIQSLTLTGTATSVTVTNCNINGNSGVASSGGINFDCQGTGTNTSTITDCCISNNSSTGGIGGIGISSINSTVSINNSTIANNSSLNVGSTASSGGIFNGGTLNLINTTISGNTANRTGGVTSNSGGTTNVGNTIIANNTSTTTANRDVNGTFITLGNNLIGDGTGSTSFVNGVNGDQVGTTLSPINPLLGPLTNNGGFTNTMELLPGSPALEAGNNALNPVGNQYDQRQSPYLRIVNSTIDIGAFESQIIVCFSAKSKVLVKNIQTGSIEEIEAQHVYHDLHQVFDTQNNIFIPIIYNIVTGNVKQFRKIPKNFFGPSKPNKNFYVTGGHSLKINENIVKVRDINGIKRINVEPQKVYSICTDKACSININGLDVMTWGFKEWTHRSKNYGIAWTNNHPNEK